VASSDMMDKPSFIETIIFKVLLWEDAYMVTQIRWRYRPIFTCKIR